MTSTSGSSKHSPVETAAVVAHGRVDVGEAVEQVRAVAERAGVELVEEPERAQLAVAVGGDGTILRTLARLLGTGIPVIGINFGRVGFLASIAPEQLEDDLARVFRGEYRTIEQPTLDARLGSVAGSAAGEAADARPTGGETFVAVNDVVATSSTLGRMIELGWSIAGEDLGVVSCDGMICSTPSGSTAYNLSNGGPVLVRGIDAMAITFIAPHSLEARPLVVPRGAELTVRNASPDVEAAVLVDGHRTGDLAPARALSIRLGEQRSLLATLPETTFFRRYRETFTS
jgi:NAD+ kinase